MATDHDRDPGLRARRTRAAIQAAFLELLEEERFAQLTVKGISERAMVNRATFYRHFENKHALLLAVFESAVGELEERLAAPPQDPHEMARGEPPAPWVDFFEHVRENEVVYRIVLRDPDAGWVRRRMRQVFFDISRARAEEVGGPATAPPVPAELTRNLAWAVIMAAVEWWLEHHGERSAEEMAGWSMRFLSRGYFDAMGFPPPS